MSATDTFESLYAAGKLVEMSFEDYLINEFRRSYNEEIVTTLVFPNISEIDMIIRENAFSPNKVIAGKLLRLY